MTAQGVAQRVDEGGFGESGQVAHRLHPEALQALEGGRPHSPQGLHGVGMKEGELFAGNHDLHSQPRLGPLGRDARLGRFGRQLGHQLARGHADRG